MYRLSRSVAVMHLYETAVPPLYAPTDYEVALRLVFADNSIWSTLKEFVDSHERTFQRCRLKQTLKAIRNHQEIRSRAVRCTRQVRYVHRIKNHGVPGRLHASP